MQRKSVWKPRLLLLFGLGLCVVVYFAAGASGSAPTATAQEAAPSDEPALPDTPFEYANPQLPNHFNRRPIRDADNTPADNPITNEGAALGRVLFYDVKLSANDSIACASCHTQATGFGDNRQFSAGFEGGQTGRSSMGLTNARYYERGAFFWDERAATLDFYGAGYSPSRIACWRASSNISCQSPTSPRSANS